MDCRGQVVSDILMGGVRSWGARGGLQGQRDAEFAAPAGSGTVDLECAAVEGDDLAGEVEADAEAGLEHGVVELGVQFEDVGLVFGRDANAGVFDPDDELLVDGFHGEGDGAAGGG